MISAADLGRVKGITEWGNIFGLIGVINMCSVQLASRSGFDRRSTSTFNVFCSNGIENTSVGID